MDLLEKIEWLNDKVDGTLGINHYVDLWAINSYRDNSFFIKAVTDSNLLVAIDKAIEFIRTKEKGEVSDETRQ